MVYAVGLCACALWCGCGGDTLLLLETSLYECICYEIDVFAAFLLNGIRSGFDASGAVLRCCGCQLGPGRDICARTRHQDDCEPGDRPVGQLPVAHCLVELAELVVPSAVPVPAHRSYSCRGRWSRATRTWAGTSLLFWVHRVRTSVRTPHSKRLVWVDLVVADTVSPNSPTTSLSSSMSTAALRPRLSSSVRCCFHNGQ